MLAKSQTTSAAAVAPSDDEPTPEVAESQPSEPHNETFNTDLWYAQTSVNLTRQKSEQLSFKAIPSKGSWSAN